MLFDEDGAVSGLEARQSCWTEQMIEEFMIAANEQVAKWARMKRIPVMYRVHGDPDRERLTALADLARGLNIDLTVPEVIDPTAVSLWIEKIKGCPMEEMLMTLILRSLAKARYDAIPYGHFGLALVDYCHFTSPIRRYSDLFTHRAIKNALGGYSNAPLKREAAFVAEHISETEINSTAAEQEATKLRICQYMEAFLWHCFEGKITGFCPAGAFVRLENTAEGLLLFSEFDDDFSLDDIGLLAEGQRTHRLLKVGDQVEVQVQSVNLAYRRIDFGLLEEMKRETKDEGKKALPGERRFKANNSRLFVMRQEKTAQRPLARKRHLLPVEDEAEAENQEKERIEVQTLGRIRPQEFGAARFKGAETDSDFGINSVREQGDAEGAARKARTDAQKRLPLGVRLGALRRRGGAERGPSFAARHYEVQRRDLDELDFRGRRRAEKRDDFDAHQSGKRTATVGKHEATRSTEQKLSRGRGRAFRWDEDQPTQRHSRRDAAWVNQDGDRDNLSKKRRQDLFRGDREKGGKTADEKRPRRFGEKNERTRSKRLSGESQAQGRGAAQFSDERKGKGKAFGKGKGKGYGQGRGLGRNQSKGKGRGFGSKMGHGHR